MKMAPPEARIAAQESIQKEEDVLVASNSVIALPEIKKFDTTIAGINIPDAQKDKIYIWWTQAERTEEILHRLEETSSQRSLPELERADSKKVHSTAREKVNTINASIGKFVQSPETSLKPRGVKDIISGLLNEPESDRTGIIDPIDSMGERGLRSLEQALAVCEAIEATKNLNLKPEIMRKKIAQWGFTEMLNLVPYWKMTIQQELGKPALTTADPLQTERDELISALQRKLWSQKEVKEWTDVYKRQRKDLRTAEVSPHVRTIFKKVFDMATTDTLNDVSAIKVLEIVENAWAGITEDENLLYIVENLDDLKEEQERQKEIKRATARSIREMDRDIATWKRNFSSAFAPPKKKPRSR